MQSHRDNPFDEELMQLTRYSLFIIIVYILVVHKGGQRNENVIGF